MSVSTAKTLPLYSTKIYIIGITQFHALLYYSSSYSVNSASEVIQLFASNIKLRWGETKLKETDPCMNRLSLVKTGAGCLKLTK